MSSHWLMNKHWLVSIESLAGGGFRLLLSNLSQIFAALHDSLRGVCESALEVFLGCDFLLRGYLLLISLICFFNLNWLF